MYALHPLRKSVLATVLFSAMGFILLALRVTQCGSSLFAFLLWNLFLALLPLFPAYYFSRNIKSHPWYGSSFLFLCWLFLFPNAPYLLTDLIHLHSRASIPLWYDASLLFCFALTGLFAGTVSLHWIHKGLQQVFSSLHCFLSIALLLLLGGYGIFLGRVLRLNSWDILVRPLEVIQLSWEHLTDPVAVGMTLTYGFIMAITYSVFKLAKDKPSSLL